MADKTEPRKAWKEMSYYELDKEALIAHALSLGGEKSVEALTYLRDIRNERLELTDEMRQQKREELKGKKKQKRQDGKLVELDELRYTDKQIEKIIAEMKPPRKYGALQVKKLYCENYYPSILPVKSDKSDFDIDIENALTQAKARLEQ